MTDAICTAPGCERKREARGFCHRHYLNWRRENPTATDSGRRRDPVERFWTKVDKSAECWVWTAGFDAYGYGSFYDGVRMVKAHRYSYLLATGLTPDTLDHTCRNRACVRPDHLEPVTRGENVLRGTGFAAVNKAKTTCPNGHPYDEFDRKGWRKCSICRKAAVRARRQAAATS